MIFWKILFTLSISLYAYSWETDNFTTRVELTKQSAETKRENLYRLNNETNKNINLAIDSFNSSNEKCTEDQVKEIPRIHTIIKNALGGGFISGALENWAADTKTSKIDIPKLDTDIYSAMLFDPDPAMNIGGKILGTDKLGHFVDQGYDLYTKFRKNGNKIEAALQHSDYLEEKTGPYGLLASGIKSYGDLGANFYGFRFYHNLLNGNESHLKCDITSGKYKMNQIFNWADYIDSSFDEGINCSLFFSSKAPLTESKLKKFHRNMYYTTGTGHRKRNKTKMNKKGKKMNKNLNKLYEEIYSQDENRHLKFNNFCPVENNKCTILKQNNCSKYYISPQCYGNSMSDSNKACSTPQPIRPVTKHLYKDYNFPDNEFIPKSYMEESNYRNTSSTVKEE